MEKDLRQVAIHKNQMIEEVKKIDKEKLFQPKKEKSIIKKILMILGYGKKG